MNLSVTLPPPYTRGVWDYNKADTKKIQRSINTCDRTKLFTNLTINERVELLSNTLINIFRSYSPNKKVKFKYGEAPWIKINIKSAFHKRTRLTKRYYVTGRVQNYYNLLLSHSNKCTEMILSAKNEYMLSISKKLNHPSTASKSYWSILNWFLNNKKIPGNPPIFHNGKVISELKKKASLFKRICFSMYTCV